MEPAPSAEPDLSLERRALRNTRALVEMLESDEQARRKRQRSALAILAAVAVVPLVVVALWSSGHPRETPAEKRQHDCKVEAWSAKASEVTERIRAENPGMPYGEIAKKLKREQESFLASAREACGSAPSTTGK